LSADDAADDAEDAPPDEFEALPPDPLMPLSLSPSPQNVRAKARAPSARIDFIEYASERMVIKLDYFHRIFFIMQNRR
jgi:hypothetical protein